VPSTTETRRFAKGLILGVFAMTLVGGSVAVSVVLGDAPLFTAQAIRYAVAAALLALIARIAGVRIDRPRGTEWLWLTGIAATGLVLFNVAVIRGVAHAEPATIAVAVACVPVVIGLVGPLLDRQRPARRVVIAAVVVTIGGIIVAGTGRCRVGSGCPALRGGVHASGSSGATPSGCLGRLIPRRMDWHGHAARACSAGRRPTVRATASHRRLGRHWISGRDGHGRRLPLLVQLRCDY